MGAVQAQEYAPARWGLGQRLKNVGDAAIQKAFDDGRILRIHILRPTWHFVSPADIRWLLALSGPRVWARDASNRRDLELDAGVLARCDKIIGRSLRGRTWLTRTEIGQALGRGGVVANGRRLMHLMLHAELSGLVCSGPRRGKQFTYALLDERVPASKTLDRPDALVELAKRYFSSHGPATIRDYVWWSGLTVRDARAGIEGAGPALERESAGGLTYWAAPSRTVARAASGVHLLPIYDEYLIAYKDRGLVAPSYAVLGGGRTTDMFFHHVILGGRLAGSWRPVLTNRGVTVEVAPYGRLGRPARSAIEAAAERYGRFLAADVAVFVVPLTALRPVRGGAFPPPAARE